MWMFPVCAVNKSQGFLIRAVPTFVLCSELFGWNEGGKELSDFIII